ncbi:unnamed protein product [Darwinula stevensoni]|uniref:Uncharacterized protein n=1 Tax=Darwinula stevensoni TaxID=69355 RepID=A0A7R8X1Q1_9CRUS|nr:unnamed protein product [Darwinula stevensoni]CAG0883045.1 unnamed protein product [Darwinula stevensoni]
METKKEKLFHEELIEKSVPMEGKNPPTYLLPFRPITARGDRYRLGEYQESGRCMNVLVIGFTGSGKSMLVEAMGNYGLGVDFRDPYRFQVKMEEPTERSISHTFFARDARRFPRPVTLIDTPGFPKGTEKICVFVLSNYLDVHAVVYVIQGSQGRLTEEQKTALENVAKIFGNETEKISYLFCTFADSTHLPVLESVKEAGLKYKRHFPVNSSAYFAKEEEDEKDEQGEAAKGGSINEFLSKMTTESIRKFFKDVQKNAPIPVRELFVKEMHSTTASIDRFSWKVTMDTFQEVIDNIQENRPVRARSLLNLLQKKEEERKKEEEEEEEERPRGDIVEEGEPPRPGTENGEASLRLPGEASVQPDGNLPSLPFIADPMTEEREEKGLHEEMIERSVEIQGCHLPNYLLPFEPITANQYRLGVDLHGGRCLNVLVLGFVGSGKSMLVEVMGNYGLGVNFRDPYRFRVKEERPTSEIISHTFFTRDDLRFPHAVTLIDTPGFLEWETEVTQKLAEEIRSFLRVNRLGIHAIVYVIPCSQVASSFLISRTLPKRPPSMWIRNQVDVPLGVFPPKSLTMEYKMALRYMAEVFEDQDERIHEISYVFVTFPDGKLHSILESVKEAGVRYRRHFPIDSSSYFVKEGENGNGTASSSEEDEEKEKGVRRESINELLFNITTKNIRKFLKEIQRNRPIQFSGSPNIRRKGKGNHEDVEAGNPSKYLG